VGRSSLFSVAMYIRENKWSLAAFIEASIAKICHLALPCSVSATRDAVGYYVSLYL